MKLLFSLVLFNNSQYWKPGSHVRVYKHVYNRHEIYKILKNKPVIWNLRTKENAARLIQ